MLSGLTSIPTKITKTTARLSIDTLIFLKEVLLIAPLLANIMKRLIPNEFSSNTPQRDNYNSSSASNSLIFALINNFQHNSFINIKNMIDETLTESTKYSKSPHEMRHEECFALKPGINGLLDVARKTYLQSVEDIYSLCESYSIELQSPVKAVYNSSRGYYITISKDINPIPPGFIQAVLNTKTISCTTEEIASLSDRATEAIDNALTLTNELIQSLMEKIRINMDFLFNLVDSIALLDMLTSFADLVALCPHPYTRPIITEDGPLVIKSGRHCIISKLGRQQLFSSSFVANDTFLSPLENFQIITGSNGSGKTVFIKQVALIVILSQIGCFVPCQHASIPIRDRILSRLGNCTNLLYNIYLFIIKSYPSS
jgi:DNA mismatch repair protein MSH4